MNVIWCWQTSDLVHDNTDYHRTCVWKFSHIFLVFCNGMTDFIELKCYFHMEFVKNQLNWYYTLTVLYDDKFAALRKMNVLTVIGSNFNRILRIFILFFLFVNAANLPIWSTCVLVGITVIIFRKFSSVIFALGLLKENHVAFLFNIFQTGKFGWTL